MGRVNTDLHDALKAQEFYLKALEIGEKTKDYHLLAKICNNLGTLYNYQDIYDLALPMQKKALYYIKHGTKARHCQYVIYFTKYSPYLYTHEFRR